jgi:hypothetical protein
MLRMISLTLGDSVPVCNANLNLNSTSSQIVFEIPFSVSVFVDFEFEKPLWRDHFIISTPSMFLN